jgi:crotonobetainyl-CoA:carnitine CoA-transferase CaiB-like acyl-CoA transferase
VEVNMLEASIAFNIEPIAQFFARREPIPVYLRGAYSQAYTVTCRDGKRIALHMSSPDKFWRNLCNAIEREEWIDVYKSHSDRVKDYEHIAFELAGIFRSRDRDAWISKLEQADVPFAPEHELQDLEADPQIQHLGVFYELIHPRHGAVKTAHCPVRVDSDRSINFRPPPTLGEHTEEVLRECGFSTEEIASLRKVDVI